MPSLLTETSRVDAVWGNQRVVHGTLAITGDGDTWRPGLGLVDQVLITRTTASDGQDVEATESGGVVTFKVEGGTPTVRATAIGYG